jgi:glycosyltransferase involved in cell wall biosynthesis
MSEIETASSPITATSAATDELTVSVVIPALNEAESIEACVRRSIDTMEKHGIRGEVIVADNGSDDGTPDLARAAGARVINEQRKGYGSAYLAGFASARGKYIVMGDADETYDFGEIARFIAPLDEGADLVMGSRLRGKIHPGAMPWLHRYVGNPVLTGVLNLFFKTGVSDAHCGMRAFRRELLPRLDLRTTGMEFASEQVIRSSKLGLDIREIPIEYHPRTGESKLSSFSDGWRHLRFLLVHSPTWLFLVPGLGMVLLGVLIGAVSVFNVPIFGRQWQLHTLIAGSMLAIVGAQVSQLGIFSRTYAFYYLGEHDPLFDRIRAKMRLEHGLIAGALVLATGLIMTVVVLGIWIHRGFGELREEKLAIAGLTLVVIGIQMIFGAFFLSILGLRRRSRALEDPQPPAAG